MFLPALIVLASQNLATQWNLEEPSSSTTEIVADAEGVDFPRTGHGVRANHTAFAAMAFVDQRTGMGPEVESLGLSQNAIFGLDFSVQEEGDGDLQWRAYFAVDGIARYPLSNSYPVFTDSSGNSRLSIGAQWPADAEGISVEIIAVSGSKSLAGAVQTSNSIYLFTLPAPSESFGELDSNFGLHTLASR